MSSDGWRKPTIGAAIARVVQTSYAVTAAAVGYVEFATSSGFFETVFYTVLGGVFWPLTVGIWIGRGWLLPLLQVKGIL